MVWEDVKTRDDDYWKRAQIVRQTVDIQVVCSYTYNKHTRINQGVKRVINGYR